MYKHIFIGHFIDSAQGLTYYIMYAYVRHITYTYLPLYITSAAKLSVCYMAGTKRDPYICLLCVKRQYSNRGT
jgi:hypothetical protein